MERKRLLGIALLTASAFTGTLAFRLATPAIAFYTKDVLGASMLYISIVSMSFVLSRSLFSLIGTLSLEKKKWLMYMGVVTMMGNAVAVHFYPLTNTWVQVAGLKAINGALNGISWPIAQFVIAGATPKKIRARITSIYFLSGSVAALLGNYIYAYTIKLGMDFQMGVSSAFFMVTGILMLGSYMILYSSVEPRKKGKSETSERKIEMRRILGIASLMAIISAFTTGEITYVYVAEALSISRSETAVILGWTGFTAAVLSYAASWLADVWSEVNIVKMTSIMMALAPLIAAVKTGPTVVTGVFLARLASQSFRPVSRKLLVGYRRSSLAIGGVNSVQNISTFVGGILFGTAYSLGEVNLGVTMSLALLMFLPFSATLLWMAGRSKPKLL